MTEDVIQKLQDKATILTQERKKKGRTIPEDLVPADSIRNFRTLSSHPVIIIELYLNSTFKFYKKKMFFKTLFFTF